jgi:flagellar protein FliJ
MPMAATIRLSKNEGLLDRMNEPSPGTMAWRAKRELHMVNGVADILARKVELLETMIREFTSTAANLAREVEIEEERTRIKDPAHVAYSTLAKAVAVRRANLLLSAADAETRLLEAQRELDEARASASAPAGAAEDSEKASSPGHRAA